MRKLGLLLLLFVVSGYSQSVMLPDFLLLQGKPASEIRQFLFDRKWKLVDERFSDKHKFGDMAFLSTTTPEESTMRLKVFYGLDKSSQTRFQLTIKTKEQFTALKASIAQTDLKFAATEVVSNTTTTVFKNESLTVRIVAIRAVGASVTYEIFVESNAYDPAMY